MAYKVCTHCQERAGVRTKKCAHCGQIFQSAPKLAEVSKFLAPLSQEITGKRKRRFKTVDWKTLVPGDMIRVVGNSGPYFVLEDGQYQYTTDRGVYRVVKLDNMGINVQGVGKLCGFHHLYMGPHVKSPLIDNLYRDKHRFKKVIRRAAPTTS